MEREVKKHINKAIEREEHLYTIVITDINKH